MWVKAFDEVTMADPCLRIKQSGIKRNEIDQCTVKCIKVS